jgi:hypothetical protein
MGYRSCAVEFQFFEQGIVERLAFILIDDRFRVVQIAEDDRPRRAGLLAGGRHLAVADRRRLARFHPAISMRAW